MADKVLYYDSSTANNLGSYTKEPDSSLATPANVKLGYMYKDASSYEMLSGTMPINTPTVVKLGPSTSDYVSMYTIPKGYHDGTGRVIVGNLEEYTYGTATAGDIATNKTAWVNGKKVVGTLNTELVRQTGNATADDIMDTRVAWVNGKKIVGKIPWLVRKDMNLTAGESYTIPYGLSPGTIKITALSLASQTQADATEEDIVKGKTAWVNGEKLIGSFDAAEAAAKVLGDTDALTSNVLEGKKFYSVIYDGSVEGTMKDHSGESTIDLKAGELWAIPEGYYNGLTKVQVSSLSDQTVANATAADLLEKKTAWVNGKKITGEMPYIDSTSHTINAGEIFTIPKGYHTGGGLVVAKDIRSQTQADSTVNDIKSGKTAWVNGEKITGEMEIHTSINETIAASEHYHIPEGYHDGTGWIWAKSLAEQTPGNALASHILEGYTAWSNGVKITGDIRIVTSTTVTIEPGESYKILKGFHDGNGVVKAKSGKDITPGTAEDSDIIKDKTAWVNGVKLTGTLDIASATATTADVLAGSTFYAGNKVEKTGTLELLGTALPEHVSAGKTFYNTNAKEMQTGTLKLTGTALRAFVLEGYTFYNEFPDVKLEGSMKNNGAIKETLGLGVTYKIPEGYHNGEGYIRTKDSGEVTEATATPEDILEGETAWVNGVKITGVIPTQSASSSTLKAGESITFPAGYYPNGFTITAESLEDQTVATATAGDMIEGSTAWVNGVLITGTIPDGDNTEY